MVELFFDLCSSHIRLILPAKATYSNMDNLVAQPYCATAFFRKAKSSFSLDGFGY